MESIKSFTEVRPFGVGKPDVKHLADRLSARRIEIIAGVEEFISEEGIERPVSEILGIFSDYLLTCGHLERLANKYISEGSEKSKAAAEEIRMEYLPTFCGIGERFYALRVLLSFVAKVGESEREADHFERMLDAIQRSA